MHTPTPPAPNANDPFTHVEMCHCGKPLHYSNAFIEAAVKHVITSCGEYVRVTVGGRSWLVQRHYIALHGLKADELPHLGFQELK